MSYRELRNFCEIMRTLGYPRLISMENFRKPNFELVADILFWLAMRYDPQADISDDIDEEKNRVEFIKQIASLFAAKTRIKLNTKKLYASDGYAVQEILKVATVLYQAYNSSPGEDEQGQGFSLPSKLSNLKAHKAVANEITEIGAKLFDSLSKENELKQHRDKALSFLDNISRNFESNSEQQYIEKCVKEIIQQQDENIAEMEKYVSHLEKDQRTLDEKIRKKNIEVERSEKRLKLLTNMKPAYMDEYERLESELEKIYEIFIEKFRNLDYLEHQLDIYNKLEEKKFQESQEKIKNRWNKIREGEIRELIGEQEIDENMLEQQLAASSRGQSRGDSRGFQNKPGSKQAAIREKQAQQQQKQQMQQKPSQQQAAQKQQYGKLQGPDEEEEEEELSGEEGEEGEDVDLEDSQEGLQQGSESDDNEF